MEEIPSPPPDEPRPVRKTDVRRGKAGPRPGDRHEEAPDPMDELLDASEDED